MIHYRRAGAAALAVAALALSACSSSGTGSTSSPTAAAITSGSSIAGRATESAPDAAGAANLYVSLGDSYGAGYQATGRGTGHTTRNGFAYQVPGLARAKGYHLSLINFACSGATTTSMLKQVGCDPKLLGPGAVTYPSLTQAAAAEAFLRSHKGKVALITISIGGNDLNACSVAANPASCVTAAVTTVSKNLTTLLTGLRAAAGAGVQIVGTTYPDLTVAGVLSPNAKIKQLATLSVAVFRELFNPALDDAYTAAGGSFVDVTKATGAYGSLTKKVSDPPYGTIPAPVAKICSLTFLCQYGDIHPRTTGYAIIAELVVGALPRR